MEQTKSSEKINSQRIHTYSFWLYSVIVGLSVEEALRHVLPHVGEFPNLAEKVVIVEFLRLSLFLTLVVRFYLGSVKYFNRAHVTDESSDYENKNYTIDFFFGLIHFSAFLALSLSIDITQPHWLYIFWLSFILLYDMLWLLASRKYDTRHLIKFWAFLNGLTWIIGACFYFLTEKIYSWSGVSPDITLYVSQMVSLIPIFIISLIDVAETFEDRPIFAKWFEKLLRIKPTKQPQSADALEEKPIDALPPATQKDASQVINNTRQKTKRPKNS